eukprot:m.7811 g.7811  ORF g.7811 m.7811 type:complete len:188 (+) comp2923_c0_seq2:1097-1660(+)
MKMKRRTKTRMRRKKKMKLNLRLVYHCLHLSKTMKKWMVSLHGLLVSLPMHILRTPLFLSPPTDGQVHMHLVSERNFQTCILAMVSSINQNPSGEFTLLFVTFSLINNKPLFLTFAWALFSSTHNPPPTLLLSILSCSPQLPPLPQVEFSGESINEASDPSREEEEEFEAQQAEEKDDDEEDEEDDE